MCRIVRLLVAKILSRFLLVSNMLWLLLTIVRNILHIKFILNSSRWWCWSRFAGLGWRCSLLSLRSLLVSLDVFVEMIRPGEPLATLWTHKPLLSSVSPQVSLQLIRSCEGLVTENPATGERSLTCMPPKMSLEMRGLAIHLATAWHVTHMLSLLALLMVTSSILTVWTLAPPAPPGSQGLSVLEQSSCYLSISPSSWSSWSSSWCGRSSWVGVVSSWAPELRMILVVRSWRPLRSSSWCWSSWLVQLRLVVVPGLVVGVGGGSSWSSWWRRRTGVWQLRRAGRRQFLRFSVARRQLGGSLSVVVVVIPSLSMTSLSWRSDGQLELSWSSWTGPGQLTQLILTVITLVWTAAVCAHTVWSQALSLVWHWGQLMMTESSWSSWSSWVFPVAGTGWVWYQLRRPADLASCHGGHVRRGQHAEGNTSCYSNLKWEKFQLNIKILVYIEYFRKDFQISNIVLLSFIHS